MIDIILKMLLGKYFEPCDKNFLTMNMNAGIEIRNIIIKNDEINHFLKSKNIDVEIVYLKIERIYISFVTLSGMLTLKLHGVDLRLKPHIHRNASKGIKNKLMNLLRRKVELLSPLKTGHVNLEKNQGTNKILCCCCESYQDVQDSLCCYNNVSKIKTYICKDCSVLKDQDDEVHLTFIKKKVALEKAHRHAFGEASRSVFITSNCVPTAATSAVGPLLYKSVMGRNHTMSSMQAEPADHVFAKELMEKQTSRDRSPYWGNLSYINKARVAHNTSATYALNRVNNPPPYYSAQMGKNDQVHVSASNGTQHHRSACKQHLRCNHSDGKQLRQGVHENIGMYATRELFNGMKNHQDKHPPRGNFDDLCNTHSKLKGKESLSKFHIYDDKMGDDVHQRSSKLTDYAGVDSRENDPRGSYHNGGVPCRCHPLSNKCMSMLYSYNGTSSNNCMRIKIDHVFNAKL
ncbi:Uncharacterized protein PCOAH_00012140 [Plasmodium coatneyi]|uniref:Uncharacterized protein n=1 Tax=Plasmodium coatneyi TaxID=208452 RepID=A0A1B1DWC9_9APIC|nr:Uncharacterized protein PCOAH_00012140 [Plasmodium coatneyi]ANQ06939.1 Uncharacterized protein PCOAH_00012140 [Plasmodium coatneyi]